MPAFVPLQVVPKLPAPERPGGAGPSPCAGPPDPDDEPDGHIEIVLPDGTVVCVNPAISTATLRRVLAALRA